MGENDFEAGYRGHQFHHGMDRAEFERGKSQKETEDILAGSNRKVEVPGVAFTLLLVAPLIWMVYPILGVTIMVVPILIMAIFAAIKQMEWGFLFAFVLGVFSFFPGMKLEAKVSQLTVYRWIRGVMRILFPFLGIAGAAGNKHGHWDFNNIPPGAIVGGFFVSVIVYLLFQRLDLIYFPALKEIKKMQEKLARGERPTRPLLKRMFFGFCWLIPVTVGLSLVYAIVVHCFVDGPSAQKAIYNKYQPIVGGVDIVIWYVLCLLGKLPGTGKYMFNKRHEEDIKEMQV